MSTAFSVAGLWWRYPTFSDTPHPWTLRDISLRVEQGSCFGITGPGGAGKTTLCRTLLGILPYNARLTPEQLPHHFRGSVEVLGEAVTAPTTSTASANRIGMVQQDPENQFLRMSVLHELAFGLQVQGLAHDEILKRICEALSWVGLGHLWHGAAYIHPSDLSGGQKQRIAIASFLALRPQILILDEPTSDLDPVGKREVIETIARLRRDYAMTVILVEQDPEILSTFCDRIALLHQGSVELVAAPSDFYSERALLEQCGASVGELARISWHSGYTCESRDTHTSHTPLSLEEAESAFTAPLLSSRVFIDEHAVSLKTSPGAREAVVEAEDVCYRYGDGTMALKGVDLTLYRGEMLGLLGPNGSGKTTFAKILAGIYRATSGNVHVMGQEARKARKHLSRSVGYVFQNPDHQLFCRSVKEEIAYGLKNLGIDATRRREIIAATLDAVDLAHLAQEDPLFLSKGQRQRLAVASILAMGPDILVVDEPTTGQDAHSIAGIMRLLCDLQQQGKTILMITHDMTLVAEYCQRVVAFRNGEITFTGTPAELFSDSIILQRTGLRPPVTAALATRLRARIPEFPPFITVQQWVNALGATRLAAEL